MQWRVELFGGPKIIAPTGESTSHFVTQKAAALLAYLALTLPHSHPREVLAELFWPEKAPERGRNNLSVALSSLRSILGPALVGDKFRIGLDPSCVTCDVTEFELYLAGGEVASAARLAAAELLPGFYDDWILTERERLKARLAALPVQTTAAPAPHNLPFPITHFIGRERELAEVLSLLEKSRLVTLTGIGGSGKTRLGLQVATQVREHFTDGVFFVELAPVTSPGGVVRTVVQALGLQEAQGPPLVATLTPYLQRKNILLVLDNCEHVLEASGELAKALLSRCPQLRVLATSRESLGVGGEVTYPTPPLSVPPQTLQSPPESLLQYDAVRFFIERARGHWPDFSLTAQNAIAISSVCSRLEGIPLALELAAARLRTLSVEELDHKLRQSFQLLKDTSRTTVSRHQTLRSSIDWSYQLLSPPERRLLERLSVFSGGWSLEGAEAVCTCDLVRPGDILDLTTSLVDKSLVIVEQSPAATRFRLLETVRQYARDCLREQGTESHWDERHLAYYVSLAEQTFRLLQGEGQRAWLTRLDAEHDNLRAALEWSATAPERVEQSLQLAGGLSRFWMLRGFLTEGRERLVKLLAKSALRRSAARGWALEGAGKLAYAQGDYPSAHPFFEQALAIFREVGDRLGIALALSGLGAIAYSAQDFPTSRALDEESLEIFRELGDLNGIAIAVGGLAAVALELGEPQTAQSFYEEQLTIYQRRRDQRGISNSLGGLAEVARIQKDYRTARLLQEESLTIRRELNDRIGIANVLFVLGHLAYHLQDHSASLSYYLESLTILQELEDSLFILEILDCLAPLAVALGAYLSACQLWGAVERLQEESSAALPASRRHYQEQREAVRHAVGEEAFTSAWAVGRTLSLERAIALASQLDSRIP